MLKCCTLWLVQQGKDVWAWLCNALVGVVSAVPAFVHCGIINNIHGDLCTKVRTALYFIDPSAKGWLQKSLRVLVLWCSLANEARQHAVPVS